MSLHFGVRFLETQVDELAQLLLRDEKEAAAIALCGRSSVADPWRCGVDERFIVKDLIEVPDSAYRSRSVESFTWSSTPFFNALKLAESKNLAVAVFHSHPEGHLAFSPMDDLAEKELFEIAFNRLESEHPHLSLIMDRSKKMIGRAYGRDLKPQTIDDFAIIGDRWRFSSSQNNTGRSAELDRQIRAFGKKSTEQLEKLRIGIVGCGGTGSAVASLLARVGVRRLALIDADIVDSSNLNRLHFSRRSDATLGRLKVDVVAEGMADIGLDGSIVRVPAFADQKIALDTLRGCDLVFGCTDDNLGREILNRLAHFYFIPVIDLGLLIQPNESGAYDCFDGRVTVVQPGYPCQSCRGLIDAKQMYLDSLRRDPQLLLERRRAGYAPNDPDPSPVVVTFTTEIASMAVNELFHRLNGFRGSDQNCSERVRNFQYLKDSDTLAGGRRREGCKLCHTRRYDGRGDMLPLLDMRL